MPTILSELLGGAAQASGNLPGAFQNRFMNQLRQQEQEAARAQAEQAEKRKRMEDMLKAFQLNMELGNVEAATRIYRDMGFNPIQEQDPAGPLSPFLQPGKPDAGDLGQMKVEYPMEEVKGRAPLVATPPSPKVFGGTSMDRFDDPLKNYQPPAPVNILDQIVQRNQQAKQLKIEKDKADLLKTKTDAMKSAQQREEWKVDELKDGTVLRYRTTPSGTFESQLLRKGADGQGRELKYVRYDYAAGKGTAVDASTGQIIEFDLSDAFLAARRAGLKAERAIQDEPTMFRHNDRMAMIAPVMEAAIRYTNGESKGNKTGILRSLKSARDRLQVWSDIAGMDPTSDTYRTIKSKDEWLRILAKNVEITNNYYSKFGEQTKKDIGNLHELFFEAEEILSMIDQLAPHIGKIDGTIGKGLAVITGEGASPEDVVKFRFLLSNLTDVLTRARTGAALNSQEEEFYGDLLGTETKDPDALRARLEELINWGNRRLRAHYEPVIINEYNGRRDEVPKDVWMSIPQSTYVPSNRRAITEEERAAAGGTALPGEK